MKEIHQLNNLQNLTSEITRPLNKTQRIKVSARFDVVVCTISISTFSSTSPFIVHLLRCVTEFCCVWRNIGQHLPVPAAALQISTIDSEHFRSDFARGHLTAGALCGVQQSQGYDTGVCHRLGKRCTADYTFHILSRNDNHTIEVATK